MNEARRERDWRHGQREQKSNAQRILQVFGTGAHVASVVNEHNLLYDPTRWRGPGKAREARLSEAAERFLRAAARATKKQT